MLFLDNAFHIGGHENHVRATPVGEFSQFRADIGVARMLGLKRNVYGVEVGWPPAWRRALESGNTSNYPNMEQLVEPFCSSWRAKFMHLR